MLFGKPLIESVEFIAVRNRVILLGASKKADAEEAAQ